jgi:hypothetical protein
VPSVYILHLEGGYKHARHYVGWATWLDARLARHGTKQGARILEYARYAGVAWHVGRVWRGPRATRNFERDLKQREYGPLEAMCLTCLAGRPARRLRTLRRLRARERRRRARERRD